MSGPASFRLSRETRDLLKQHQDFFSSVLDLFDGKGENPQKTPLKFKPADAEARTEAEVKPNGDVEVTFIIPLDDNEKAGDGRVYLKDKFVFDPTQKVLKGYKRSFEHNGKGDPNAWKGWLGKYEGLLKDGPGLGDKRVQSFGLSVARTFGQNVVDEKGQTLETFREAFKREHRYLDEVDSLIQEQAKRSGLEGLRLRIKDKDSSYQVLRNGDRIDLIFKWMVDGDGEPENGRIWLKDRFTFSSGKFVNLSRDWAVDPKSEASPNYSSMVEGLKRQPAPSTAETKAFGENIFPNLVPQKAPDPQDLTPLIAASMKGPAGESVFKSRNQGGPALDAAQKQVLLVLEVLAKESVANRADHAQGLLNFNSKVDVGTELAQVESLFKKLTAARDQSPAANLKVLLEGLELSSAEDTQRQRLLKSTVFRELISLAQEKDVELRHSGLLHLAESRLFIERGYPGTAMAIADMLKEDPNLGAKAGKFLDLANGKGSFGSKVEMTLGHFNKEMTKPSMLVGMMAAPFAGAAFEAGGLRLAKYLYDAKKIQSIGTSVKLGASGLGIVGESLAFTGMHRGYERLWHGSEKAWTGAGDEILSSMLLFVGMRATHAGTGWASSRAAEGKLNFKVRGREVRFGGREGTAAHGPNLYQATPTGRMLMGNPWVPEAGTGAATLTKLGQFSAGTANHLGGIFAMQASGWASRQLGIAPDNGQGFGANFFDATVMYGQAMIGFSLANRATMGKLQPTLGEVKMRIQGFDAKAGYTPIAPESKGGNFEFGPWLQKIAAKRAAAKPKPAVAEPTAKGSLRSRVRESLGSVGEWFSNLAPSRVKNLESKLAEVEAKKSAAETDAATKGKEIADLEAKVTELTGERDNARSEATGHKTDAADKASRLSQVETELGQKQAEAEAKGRALSEAQDQLAKAEAKHQDTEAKRQAAEGKLQAIEENAEAADLGLTFPTPSAEIEGLRQKIQVLSAEKGQAEVRAATLGQEAAELRGDIDIARKELKRREGIDQALREVTSKAGNLEAAKAELENQIAELRRDITSKNNENIAASELVGQMGQRISDLETAIEHKGVALEEGAAEIKRLRGEVESTAREAQLLADRLRESDVALGTANHQLEIETGRVETLKQAQAALEREKGELQEQLAAKSANATELNEKLTASEKSLTEVKRELNAAKLALETAETVKKGQREENGRMREAFSEAQTKHNKETGKLSASIRELEGQVTARQRQIDEALAVAEELRGKLSQETSRADEAEARGNELQGKHEELQAQHEQTKKDLENASRLLHIAEAKVASQERQLEREKRGKESLVSNLEALRNRKKALDGEIIEIKAEKARLETRLEDTARQLEELRNEDPVVDLEAQLELQQAQEAFDLEKSQFETRISELETKQAQLKEKTESLEREKVAAERRVRSLETDIEMANGAAESRAKDLEELQTRSRQEAEGLRSTLEIWRQKATDAESGKAKAESRVGSLEGELGRARNRLESVEAELKVQIESLKNEQGKTKELETHVENLVGEKQALESELRAKEVEMALAKSEAQDQIDSLTRDRDTHAGHLREKTELAERLQHEIAERRSAVVTAERLARETKDEARKDQNRLSDEKRAVQRELDTKVRELASAQASLGELRTQVGELENKIAEVRRESEAKQDLLASEKRDLETDLQARDQELTDARSQLAESDAKVAELGGLLDAANVALEGERAQLTNLRAEHEEAKLKSEATIGRLREEARKAGEAKETAEGRAREANAKVSNLETEIAQVRAKAEEEVRVAQGKTDTADQRAGRAEENATARLRELEALRSSTAADAEKLRNEALNAAKEKGIAEAKVEQLEKDAEVSRQRITTIEAELNAANAHVEALQAPASQHEEAEGRAQRLSGELASEKQKLIAAEAKAEASASKVAKLESDLAAQRATNSQDALRHQAEAELHENKALAAEERANAAEARASAAEERVIAAEAKAEAERSRAEAADLRKQEAESRATAAETEARRVKAASDQASGVSGEVLRQRDRRIQGLEGDLNAANAEIIEKDRAATAYETSIKGKIAGLEEKARNSEQSAQEAEARAEAAETRATEAEGRASESERTAKELDDQLLKMAKSLSSAKDAEAAAKTQVAGLLEQKWELERKIGNLEQTIGGLEQQVLEKIAERSKVEGEAQARIGELETKIRENEAEIERLNGEIQNVWTQGQNAGKESIDQKGEIDRLNDEISVLKEDLRVAMDAQHTVDLLAESERKLAIQVRALSRERNEAQARISELEREIEQGAGGIDPEISLAAYNLRSAGAGEGFFHQLDPRKKKVSISVKDSVVLRRADGMPVGEAKIVAGGEQGDLVLEFLDGTNVSARTTMAGRKYQEDGAYLSRFSLPDGREVKILTGSDGAGGHKSGDLASSTFLQGVHARVVEAAQEGRIPTAGELFEQGEQALWLQKEQHISQDNGDGKHQDPTGTGAVIVMVGDEATIASKGDSNVLWARPNADGEFEVVGLTETDAFFDTPNNLAARKYNVIVRGVGIEPGDPTDRGPRLYAARGIRQGDRFLAGSDGFWGVMVGPDLVEATSSKLRQMPRNWPEASQDTFEVVRWGLKASAGQVERAEAWHDLALQQMKNPSIEKTFFGETRKIDFRDRPDNIFAIDLEQGLVTPNTESIIPEGYENLWPVLSLAETRQRAALAGDATQPKIPSSVPPPLPSSRTKTAIQNEFSGKYVDALVGVYGSVFQGGSERLSTPANEATRQFIELYLRYPELENQINPALLQAADRVGQIKIFDGAQKFLEDIPIKDPAKVHAAKGILKNLKELRKVFPKASPEEVGQVQAAYQTTLHRVFGAESNRAAQIFANLHKAAPHISTLFTPDTLASQTLFNQAYFYREMSEKVAASGQSYRGPTQQEMAEVFIKHQSDLERVFGPALAPQAAEWFAGLYKTVPSLKNEYTPGKLQIKKFNQQLIRFFNIDSVKMTDSTAGTNEGPIGYAADIKNLSEQVQANRTARGWSSPESVQSGIRVWTLTSGNAYEGGRREGAIILDDSTVSTRHFRIRSHEKEWLLEEIQATNGVFVNGKVLKSGKIHSLKDGDKLRFGHLELQWNVSPENHGRLSDVVTQVPPVEAVPPQPQPSVAQAKPADRQPAAQAAPNSNGQLIFNVSTGSPFILGHEQIADYGISPEHLLIQRVKDKWFVQDRGSTYGTRLNGTDIQAEMGPRGGRPPGKQFELKPDDELKIGNILLRWNGNGQLVQSGGSIQPPSTRLYRPTPGQSPQELKPGETRTLFNNQQHQIGMIQWDPSRNQFLLRNGLPNPELWVQQQGQTYALNEYCILADGAVFGIGPNPHEAQYFLFRNNVIVAVQPQPGRSHSPAAGIQAPLHLQYTVADPNGTRLGREQFRNHPSISGEHLDFRRRGDGQWEVRDAASLNGTYLNGQKISVGMPEKGDKRVVGDWRLVKPGDNIDAGAFRVRFHAEGQTFSLDEVPLPSSEEPRSGPIPSEGYPNAFRPSPTSGYREAQVNMDYAEQGRYPIFLGDSRTLLVTKKKGDPGLYYSNPDQPLIGEYYLNLGSGGWQGIFNKDLFSLERLDGERYKLTNIGAKNSLLIKNGSTERKVGAGGVDNQVVAGETVLLDNGKIKIELNK